MIYSVYSRFGRRMDDFADLELAILRLNEWPLASFIQYQGKCVYRKGESMQVRIDKGVATIKLTKRESDNLATAKATLQGVARVCDSDEQRAALEFSIEEIGKVLAGTTEEAMATG